MSEFGRDNPDPRVPPPATATGGFDLNGPTIVSLLYLSAFLVGVTGIVGVVLAYIWKGEARDPWEASHYEYLIRTFWIGLIGSLIGLLLLLVLIGFVVLPAIAVLVVVRCVLSLVNAQKRAPMPNPRGWLA